MKKITGCLIFCFLFHISLAQNREVDSLNRLLAVAKEDTNKIQLLVRLSFLDGSFGHGLQLAQDGLVLARKLKYVKGEADCLQQLGNQFVSADNFTLALQNFLASLKLREHLDDPEGYSRSLASIGVVYKNQGDYSSALSYYRRAIAIQIKFSYNYRLAYTSASIGEIFEAMNQLDSALLHFQSSYAYFNTDPNKYQMAKALNGLGSVELKMGNKELALSYYRMGTINAIAFNDSSKLAINYLGIAQLFQQESQIDSSIQYAKSAIAVAFNAASDVRISANKLLAQLLVGKNDREAIKYLFLAMDLKDSNLSATKSMQIQNQLFNEQERQREIAEAVLKTKEERKRNLQYAAIVVGLISFIILFFLLSRSIIVKEKFIKFFGIVGLLAVFEFINLYIHPYLDNWTNHSPFLMLAILICIGALLVPLHHKLEKWITRKMVEKNKKIRLAAAKKTIQQLEG
jgi:tetratricopeptide (TPR) repeat protein